MSIKNEIFTLLPFGAMRFFIRCNSILPEAGFHLNKQTICNRCTLLAKSSVKQMCTVSFCIVSNNRTAKWLNIPLREVGGLALSRDESELH